MNDDDTFETMPADERARLRKQMADQAVKLAIGSRWDEAAAVNREYLRHFGDEAEAHNRLGKALAELGQVTEARKSYSRSLEIDPTNTIARRNLDRLASMRDAAVTAAPTQLDTRLFIEESGKAALATLQAIDESRAALLDAGDLVELRAEGNAVNAHTVLGDYVGMVEPRIGLRLAKMMAGGNQYSAALVSTTGDLKVMIRETFQHPSLIGRVSFPQARAGELPRGYTRRGLLRSDADREADYSDDDEPEEEEEREEVWAETGEGAEAGVDVDIEPEDESYD